MRLDAIHGSVRMRFTVDRILFGIFASKTTMHLHPLFSGVTFGLGLAFMLGPVFFTLLQTSIQEGFKAGLFFALGVFSSDAALITACYFSAAQLDLLSAHKQELGIVGGAVLIGFGLVQLLRKPRIKEVEDSRRAVHAHYILKGFMLNTLNPMVLLFWLSVVGIVALRKHYTSTDEAVFFGSVLGTVLCTDVLKCYLANRLKRIMTPKLIHRLNLITGIILIGFGAELLIRSLLIVG
jgi:threonine/homoserine/homoserine lactone efflux protein